MFKKVSLLASDEFTRACLVGGQGMYYAVEKCGETPTLKQQASEKEAFFLIHLLFRPNYQKALLVLN
jgi:hypothetical protein